MERLEAKQGVEQLLESLRKHGVGEEVIASAMAEVGEIRNVIEVAG